MTPGVSEQECVIIWTDYATLSPFLMTLSILIQVLYRKKVNFWTDFFTFFAKKNGLTISKTVRNRNNSEFQKPGWSVRYSGGSRGGSGGSLEPSS